MARVGARDNWNSIAGSPISLASVNTTRGFTGHEQLDEVGLVHMNGRVYDPQLGRFLSADPQVQYTSNLQNYNRYTYVNNNPLSFTDPSGFSLFGFKGIRKAIKKAWENPWVRLAIGVAVAALVGPIAFAHVGFATGSGALAAAAGGFAGGFALGGITTGSLKGALIGGLQGAAFGYVGHGTGLIAKARNFAGGLGKAGLHGAVGGTFSRAQGGSFKEGFVSAAATSFVNVSVKTRGLVASTVRSAVAGGVAASATGGKFINGAKTAAFSYLFNDAFSQEDGSTVDLEENEYEALQDPDGNFYNLNTDGTVSLINDQGLENIYPEAYITPGGLAAKGYIRGAELSMGKNFRLAPFGNRTGHPTGRFSHYHRRVIDRTGNVEAGQGIRRHRPWDTRSTDKTFSDRF